MFVSRGQLADCFSSLLQITSHSSVSSLVCGLINIWFRLSSILIVAAVMCAGGLLMYIYVSHIRVLLLRCGCIFSNMREEVAAIVSDGVA